MRAPPYHYIPRNLVYDKASHWHTGSMDSVGNRIRDALPPALQPGFRVLRNGAPREEEDRAIPVVKWMEEHGRRLGYRVPSARVRARATGQGRT